MSTPIVFTDVSMSYEKPPVNLIVKNLTLSIRQGEFFCMVGPSGCGKSSVLKMIAGIVDPNSGALVKPERVGMVFQAGALLPWRTVEENVSFPAEMSELDPEKIWELTEEYLAMVHLEEFRKRYPRELSGGQRQRVGIARALATESNVLLLDEPFSALDPVITDELHADLLRIWEATRKTVVMVTHRIDEAIRLADRIGIMKEGRLETALPVPLPRPRHDEQQAFTSLAADIRRLLEKQKFPDNGPRAIEGEDPACRQGRQELSS